MLIAVLAVGILIAAYVSWIRDVVAVSNASPDEKIHTDYYFGIDEPAEIQNILNISGVFKKRTRLTAELYLIKNGGFESLNGFSVGRSPNRIGAPWLVTMNLTLALGEKNGQFGTLTQLGCYGHTRGGGSSVSLENTVDRKFTKTYNGTITPGNELIIYVSGNKQFDLKPNQTIEDFAITNSGEYLVIVSSLH